MILVFSGMAHAQNQSWIGRLCQPLIGTKTHAASEDIFKAACKRKVEEADCANYFSDKDVPMSDRNTCDFTALELQIAIPFYWLMSCPSSAFDGVMNGPDIVTGTIDSAWDALDKVKSMEQPTAMAQRHQRVEQYKEAVKASVDFLSLPTEQKHKLFEEAQAERDRAYAASRVIENTLAETNIALYCYSPKKQVELSCYGLGVALNNLAYISGAKGLYGGAKYVGKKALKAAGGVQTVMSKLYKAAGFRFGGARYLQQSAEKVAKNLGYKPVIQDASRLNENFIKIQARNEAGEEVAMMTGTLKESGKFLDTTYTNIGNAANRNKGLSEYVLNETLARNPSIRRIGSTITEGENLGSLQKALDAGASCIQALTQTPAYKAQARSGFGTIVKATCEAGEYPYMIVERGH